MGTIGEDLPKEMARVRDEVLPVYLSVGAPGAFAATMMRLELDRASKAMIEGDLAEMIRSHKQLKEYRL